eukprot:111009-Pleurochrysis_carterae.AAC.1
MITSAILALAIIAFDPARETACCSNETALLCALAASNACAQQLANSVPRPPRLLRRPAHPEAS